MCLPHIKKKLCHCRVITRVVCPNLERTFKQTDNLSQVACFSEDLKCWGAWDTTFGHKAKYITSSIAWKREAWKEETLDDFPWKDERGPSSIRRTLELFQRQRWGNFRETRWSAYGLFRAHRYHLELNWNTNLTDTLFSFNTRDEHGVPEKSSATLGHQTPVAISSSCKTITGALGRRQILRFTSSLC